jgi:hypothetical protein
LTIINKKTILTSEATICMFALALLWICAIVQAQTNTTFKPTDKFSIPAQNGTISFATGGTYTAVSLENDTWNFENLRLNNTGPTENLRASAQNCDITITSYQVFVTATVGAVLLSYTVAGHGAQTFNLGFNSTANDWSVIFNNNDFRAQNNGWHISPDSTLTITGATSNVTIFYYNFPDAVGGNTSNQPFYKQHSVAITTAIVVAVALASTVIIRRKNQSVNTQNSIKGKQR